MGRQRRLVRALRREGRMAAGEGRAAAGEGGREERAARRRRDPATARQELLDAAERVFAHHQPDRVGLKEVAREAGVSHALITHYFGTYAGLVEATLERRVRTLRERMMARLREAGALSRPAELLGMLFDQLEDPVHLRLMKWMVANERPGVHLLALQEHGVQLIARQVAQALLPEPPPAMLATLELTLATAVAAAFGWALSKYAISGAIGRPVTPALQDGMRTTLAGMVRTYLRETIGPYLPGPLPFGDA
jgi:AcrR family transcriptional regulator